jgi:hypothetical protein
MRSHTAREAVGVFNHPDDLQGAIDELLSSGFDRAELSLLASEHVVEQKLGHRYESSMADDPTIPRAAYVSTEAIGIIPLTVKSRRWRTLWLRAHAKPVLMMTSSACPS